MPGLNLYTKPRTSQKKALLIGISYEESAENGTLQGPHNGVLELRELLISGLSSDALLGDTD